jgi:hypothetical protein
VVNICSNDGFGISAEVFRPKMPENYYRQNNEKGKVSIHITKTYRKIRDTCV